MLHFKLEVKRFTPASPCEPEILARQPISDIVPIGWPVSLTRVEPMRVFAILLLALLLPVSGASQDRYRQAVDIGVVDSVWSAALEEYRPYLVYTPRSYNDTTATPQRYPVLYLLDGNDHFHSVSGIVERLGATDVIPEMIVVAIPNTDRARDLTPTHSITDLFGEPEPRFEDSGGNPAFFTFLQNELIPHIESRFRTMPYRVFVGHSFGGITTLNALYTIPETFDAYVAIDPSLWWDDETLLRQAKDYFSSAELDGKALYVAQANKTDPDATTASPSFSAITQFDAVMRAYNRSGIRYGFRYYDDDDHGSVPLISEYDALRFIFDGYRVPFQRIAAEPSLLAEHFQGVSARLGVMFKPSEALVLGIATDALAQDQDTANAIQLGEIAMELYPDSHRAAEFLGDVWAAKGDKARALGYYEQALAKSPGNDGLDEKISQLGGIG